MSIRSFYSEISRCYNEHREMLFPFLVRSEEDALGVKNNNLVPLSSLDNVLITYKVAKARFEESNKVKSTLSLLKNDCSTFHGNLITLTEKQYALDEKIKNKHTNFIGTLTMIISGAVALPVGLLFSLSWMVTASAVFILVGYGVSAFNFIYYKEEEKKMLLEYSLILVLLRNMIPAAELPAATP